METFDFNGNHRTKEVSGEFKVEVQRNKKYFFIFLFCRFVLIHSILVDQKPLKFKLKYDELGSYSLSLPLIKSGNHSKIIFVLYVLF